MLVLLRFNPSNASSALSGEDHSGSGNHFLLEGVDAVRIFPVRLFGVNANGTCFCSQFAPFGDEGRLAPAVCDHNCVAGSSQICGSSANTHVVSAYGRGTITIGRLSPEFEYSFTASFVTSNGDVFDVDKQLVARTTEPTIPGQISLVNVVERREDYLEIQWSEGNDDGGSAITKYEVFVNGLFKQETADGDTFSAALENVERLSNCTITVRAVNALGAGPGSDPLLSLAVYSEVLVAPRALQPLRVSGGWITFSAQNASLNASELSSANAGSPLLVIQHRTSASQAFIDSIVHRSADSHLTVYKLQHDTGYVFRSFLVNSAGTTSSFSPPVIVRTGKPGAPGRTPMPLVSQVTGPYSRSSFWERSSRNALTPRRSCACSEQVDPSRWF